MITMKIVLQRHNNEHEVIDEFVYDTKTELLTGDVIEQFVNMMNQCGYILSWDKLVEIAEELKDSYCS